MFTGNRKDNTDITGKSKSRDGVASKCFASCHSGSLKKVFYFIPVVNMDHR